MQDKRTNDSIPFTRFAQLLRNGAFERGFIDFGVGDSVEISVRCRGKFDNRANNNSYFRKPEYAKINQLLYGGDSNIEIRANSTKYTIRTIGAVQFFTSIKTDNKTATTLTIDAQTGILESVSAQIGLWGYSISKEGTLMIDNAFVSTGLTPDGDFVIEIRVPTSWDGNIQAGLTVEIDKKMAEFIVDAILLFITRGALKGKGLLSPKIPRPVMN